MHEKPVLFHKWKKYSHSGKGFCGSISVLYKMQSLKSDHDSGRVNSSLITLNINIYLIFQFRRFSFFLQDLEIGFGEELTKY